MNALTSQSDSDISPTHGAHQREGVSADAPPRITVVTCAYTEERWDALVDAVASAHEQDPPPHEVVVVIDHNDDLLWRARRELTRARVVANVESRGLSGARNTGIRHATGEIVAFLDDDARARPGWLRALTRAFADPAVIGAGGVALPVWESAAPAWIPLEFLWVVGCSYRGLPRTRAEIRNPIGANMAFRRSVLERVGGFTDGIGRVGRTPLGCEETELSIRARLATGGRIVQIPAAEVEHRVSPDRTRWRYFRRRCWAEGLSKAVVARSVGTGAALERERSYVMRTLPAGVVRGLADAFSGDRSGVARSGAIVAGLMITAAGYLLGLLSIGPRGHG
jgi:cellulose synthase/poly-beta-1,6-N-acetylglucosamine synthase-like glycosyltransferase